MPSDIKYLLSRISEGDESAFSEIFHRYSGKVYAFSLKLTQSETVAEEIVQEVFLKIWVHRTSLVSIEFFPSYLYTITRNHAFNVLKRLAREEHAKAVLEKQLSEAHTETEETIIYQEYQNMIDKVINDLPPQQKLVYSLCHQEGLKYEEVARRLHISRLTVKTHMQQALRTIKSHLSGMITSICLFFVSNL